MYIYIYIYIPDRHISVQRSQRNSVIGLTENISYVPIDLYHILNTPVLSKFIVYYIYKYKWNKANLRDLIAATGLVTLLGQCDLEIGPMALKNNRDFLPCPFQLCVSFHCHQCIQLGLTVRKRSNRVKIGIFCLPWPRNWTYYIKKQQGTSPMSSSLMRHFVVSSEFKFELIVQKH